jgi:hypothetical protein
MSEQTVEQLRDEYHALAHAMQSGVKYQMEIDAAAAAITPKHLRVGVNSAFVETQAIAELCMAKGVFTEREYYLALRNCMLAEVKRYEKLLTEHFKKPIYLL